MSKPECPCLFAALMIICAFQQASHAEDGDLNKDPVAVSMNEQVHVYELSYDSDGLSIAGYAIVPNRLPPDGSNGFPCIIYNRGGNNRGPENDGESDQGRNDWGKLDPESGVFKSYLAGLAAKGYVVVASQYRGLGPDDVWADNGDKFGGDDVNDVLNLIPLLKKLQANEHPRSVTLPDDMSRKVDAGRIGMYGWSRGGMMTYLALRRLRERSEDIPVQTAVVGAGLTDLFDSEYRSPGIRHDVYARLIGNEYARDRTKTLEERSAVYWVDKLPKSVSILMLHGTWDEAVHISQARRMAQQLAFHSIPHQSYFVERADHGFRVLPFNPIEERESPVYGTSLRGPIVSSWFASHFPQARRGGRGYQ